MGLGSFLLHHGDPWHAPASAPRAKEWKHGGPPARPRHGTGTSTRCPPQTAFSFLRHARLRWRPARFLSALARRGEPSSGCPRHAHGLHAGRQLMVARVSSSAAACQAAPHIAAHSAFLVWVKFEKSVDRLNAAPGARAEQRGEPAGTAAEPAHPCVICRGRANPTALAAPCLRSGSTAARDGVRHIATEQRLRACAEISLAWRGARPGCPALPRELLATRRQEPGICAYHADHAGERLWSTPRASIAVGDKPRTSTSPHQPVRRQVAQCARGAALLQSARCPRSSPAAYMSQPGGEKTGPRESQLSDWARVAGTRRSGAPALWAPAGARARAGAAGQASVATPPARHRPAHDDCAARAVQAGLSRWGGPGNA